MNDEYDVLVIGGGAAGLGGALALARSRRTVLVIDAGQPRNAPASGVHNFLTRDGLPPAELAAIGRAEVARYGGEVVAGRVDEVVRDGAAFRAALADGRRMRARRLLLATGLRDELPELPGLAERWGRDVLHCPYCHGWEMADRRIGVLATGPLSVHQAQLWRQLTPHLTLLLHEPLPLDEAEAERLAARGIAVVAGPVAGLQVVDDTLTGVRLASGAVVELDGLVVAPTLRAQTELAAALGVKPVEMEMGGQVIGARIEADANGFTGVPGVWVAGNVTDPRAQVITSAAEGLTAGAMINADLVAEDTERAVAAHRRSVGQEPLDDRAARITRSGCHRAPVRR